MHYQNIDFGKTKIEGKDRGPDYDQIFKVPPINKTILDIGCNIGYYSLRAGLDGAKKVVGIDNHQAFIDIALKLCNELELDNVQFGCINFENIPEEKFDIVLCLNTMHHLPSFQKVENWVRKMARMSNEAIIIETLHTDKYIEKIANRKGNEKIHVSIDFIRHTLPEYDSFISFPSKVTENRDIIIAWEN